MQATYYGQNEDANSYCSGRGYDQTKGGWTVAVASDLLPEMCGQQVCVQPAGPPSYDVNAVNTVEPGTYSEYFVAMQGQLRTLLPNLSNATLSASLIALLCVVLIIRRIWCIKSGSL